MDGTITVRELPGYVESRRQEISGKHTRQPVIDSIGQDFPFATAW